MQIYPIITERYKKDGGACFGVVPKSIWGKYIQSDANNLIDVVNRCLLIKTNNRLVLIDTGTGKKQNEKFLKYEYIQEQVAIENEIEKIGFSTEDVTDIIFTHLHYDHCGGALKWKDNTQNKQQIIFKNAVHWITKAQWQWAINPNVREKASYLPENYLLLEKENKIKFVDKEGEHIPEIFFKIVNGHTDGQIIPVFKYQNRIISFMADFIPSVLHIPLPYVPSFDTRPLLSMKEKENYLQQAYTENHILFFEHDAQNEICQLHNTEKGIRCKTQGKLSDFFPKLKDTISYCCKR